MVAVHISKHSLFRLKITVGCRLSKCPSIHFSLDEDTLKITIGCLVCGVCGVLWCVVKLGTLSLSLAISPSSSLSLSFSLFFFFFFFSLSCSFSYSCSCSCSFSFSSFFFLPFYSLFSSLPFTPTNTVQCTH